MQNGSNNVQVKNEWLTGKNQSTFYLHLQIVPVKTQKR